ncbi:hypothetical protein JOD31_002339 [Methylopila capsulata]|uniref:Uncharacterized protein n=1 Tax=Methylopila capsulata TaxID=61654 RepID=A0A9W6IU86_9HYPH|nr:hypothetical protein [Methylopila capsulata]MBM7852097.1 hypothetical protein [Methylopila capsulata]GLK56303.1 hypothetical protein GCM10008170_23220 [Methylopila capsulata]
MTAPQQARRALPDDASFAALEQRVYGLERMVQDLNQLFSGRIGEVSAQLSGLGAKLDERSRTPWATIVSAMGVVLALAVAGGQLAKSPIDDALARLERDVLRLDLAATPLSTFAEFKGAYADDRRAARDDLLSRREAEGRAFDRLNDRLDRLERGGER